MNIYTYSKTAFPKLVQRKLEQLRKTDKATSYETALKLAAREDPALYESYSRGVEMDGNL